MSGESSIEWTDATWNPTRGCSVVSPGCHNCYAMKVAHRFSGEGMPYHGLTKMTRSGPQWTGDVRLVDGALSWPLTKRKPQRIFVNSMSDLFHESLPDHAIDAVFGVMWASLYLGRAARPGHVFQVLTKRAERMRDYMTTPGVHARWAVAAARRGGGSDPDLIHDQTSDHARRGPHPRIWLGVSTEDQARADERIPHLAQTPAAVRFVSGEPLIGSLVLRPEWLHGRETAGIPPETRTVGGCAEWAAPLDLVIVGGESGAGARPCNVAWLRSIVRQCADANVACFVKQLGAMPVSSECDAFASMGDTDHGWVANLRDHKGGDPDEWPIDLRVRQLPEAAS